MIPARLDRLPWSRFHWTVVLGLGTVWILDGLEVTLVSAVSGRITEHGSGLGLSSGEAISAGGIYVGGAVAGALFFGWLTDRYGRRTLFMITLGVYMIGTALTGASWVPAWYFAFRFITGMGIGGEYAAINSAIDELIPARVRGRVDLIINGSYWLGAMAAAALSLLLLDTAVLPKDVGWRVCFAIGLALATAIMLVRRNVPESPRWLFIHGREREAEEIVDAIEHEVRDATGVDELPEPEGEITVRQRESIGFVTIAKAVFGRYPRRSVLGLSLFVGQAFLYNAIFFSYVLILKDFFHDKTNPELYLIPFAAGNFLGPLILGRLFDTIGRRIMISSTYVLSGICLAITAWMFYVGNLDTATQTIAFVVVFFLASAGASSAYLTVSEVFPMETRALAIAFFYSIGTAAGGISGPLLFAELVASKKPGELFAGYMLGAALMIAAGIVAAFLAVDAEQRSLEDIAAPLTAEGAGEAQPPGGEPPPGKEPPAPGLEAGAPAGTAAVGEATATAPRRARRRLRPGPGRAGWSPGFAVSQQWSDVWLEHEVQSIERALAEQGPLARTELARLVGARYWGPGVFRTAVRQALVEGRARSVGGRVLAPSDRPRATGHSGAGDH